MFAWLHNVPELSFLTLLSFHCLFRPAEARQLRWCDVKIVDGSLSTRYEKFMTSCTSENPKRAAWQAVQLSNTCFWNVLVNTMKSSIPDHGLQTAIWRITAPHHFAFCQRQLRSLGVSHQHYTLLGFRGGGATDHWLQHRDSPQLRRRGRLTSERTLGRHVQEGTFLLHQNRLSKEVADSILAGLAPRFFAEQHFKESRHQPLQPPRRKLDGRCVHSVLPSGVEQQSCAHTVLPFRALPLPLSDVGQKQRTSRRRTRFEDRHAGMDHVVSRRRRSRFGAVLFLSFFLLIFFVFHVSHFSNFRALSSAFDSQLWLRAPISQPPYQPLIHQRM